MDVLAHIFIPLTIVYFLKKKSNPYYILTLAFFGLLPDLDKVMGLPGVLHSIITLTIIILPIFIIEKIAKRSWIYTSIIAFFIFSHLLLDLLDASPIFPFYPFSNIGIIIEFPLRISFNGPSFSFIGSLIQVTYTRLETGFNTYNGIISGFGITSALLFITLFIITKKSGKEPVT
ncbi:MAG: metal-dependent hydrolase [Methanobacteriales archaeon]|nr:metal-dependent hydrolase [Methanobacteriales archaeon]